MSLRDVVHSALDNALDNGYRHIITDAPTKVAVDLKTCDAQCERYQAETLEEHVATWQKAHTN